MEKVERLQKYRNDRQIWIDVCRGIGIILVVFAHTNSPFKNFIYGFHMPLFFMISGIILDRHRADLPFIAQVKKYIKRYIIPYIILCGINLVLQLFVLLVKGQLNTALLIKYLIGILYSRGTTEWMPNCSPLCFLTTLFITLLVCYWIFKIKNKYIMFFISCACALTSYLLDIFGMIKLPWNIDTALMGVFFVYLGYVSGKLFADKCQKNTGGINLLVVLLLIIGSICIVLNPVEQVNFDDNHYGNLFFMLCGAAFFNFGIITLCFINKDKMKGRIASCLSFLGKHTMFIMGFDYFSGNVSTIVFNQFGIGIGPVIFISKMTILVVGIHIWYFLIEKCPKCIKNNLQY